MYFGMLCVNAFLSKILWIFVVVAGGGTEVMDMYLTDSTGTKPMFVTSKHYRKSVLTLKYMINLDALLSHAANDSRRQ